MTPRDRDIVWDIERRIERRRHWQRVRWFAAIMAAGFFASWGLVELAAWIGGRLRGWL